jgi:Arc/MetJ-type ribon-helix-helix transcriptional regulator
MQMSQVWMQMKIRLPPELHGWIKKRAEGNYRPMNSEMVRILVELKESEKEEKKEVEKV